jgi:general nucleoside transport system ATP-binding protein
MRQMKAMAPSIEAIGVTKRFGAFTALDGVSLKVRAASVHALLGENGAGKSTLVKCLLGYHPADAGSFLIDDKEVAIANPHDADRLGLGMVYQHFTLVPSMTVAENLVMARADVPAVIDWGAERERLKAFMAKMPFKIPHDVPVTALAAGERQKAEILKQLYLDRRVLVLDEPTSTLTPQEAEEVLGLVRSLVSAGDITVVIITHKLKEVAAFADDVTVLRRGKMVGGGSAISLAASDLTALMIGEASAPSRIRRLGSPASEPRLSVKALRTEGDQGRPGLDIAELVVRPREIVGVAGVSGNGQRDLVEVLGGQRSPAAGSITVGGAPYAGRREQAFRHKVRLLPEEPLRNGCVAGMSVIDNLNLRRFDRGKDGSYRVWLDRRAMAARGEAMIEAFAIRVPAADAPIATLSGGNVQRAALARELDGEVDLFIVANPCFGLDVKAVAEIRDRIVAARNSGAAVLLISEDLDEILELADRIVVMRDGRIVHETPGEGAEAHAVGRHMVGHGH